MRAGSTNCSTAVEVALACSGQRANIGLYSNRLLTLTTAKFTPEFGCSIPPFEKC